jgi:hypothetical protein
MVDGQIQPRFCGTEAEPLRPPLSAGHSQDRTKPSQPLRCKPSAKSPKQVALQLAHSLSAVWTQATLNPLDQGRMQPSLEDLRSDSRSRINKRMDIALRNA